MTQTEKDFRELMSIPENYTVLFMQGGASLEFTSIPLNLSASNDESANYLTTGSWSVAAKKEAKKYIKVNEVW